MNTAIIIVIINNYKYSVHFQIDFKFCQHSRNNRQIGSLTKFEDILHNK